MKILLRKNLAPHLLRFDEMSTVLCEAEAILNSQPLTHINDDNTTAGQVLTPAHFLLGRPLLTTPLLEVSEAKLTTLRRWKLVSKLQNDLWNQWLKHYVNTLHQRSKWHNKGKQLQINDLVYIKQTPLRLWPIARVTKVFPGDDGQIRAAQVRCGSREYSRAINMLIPVLPEETYTHENKDDFTT